MELRKKLQQQGGADSDIEMVVAGGDGHDHGRRDATGLGGSVIDDLAQDLGGASQDVSRSLAFADWSDQDRTEFVFIDKVVKYILKCSAVFSKTFWILANIKITCRLY